MPLLNHVQAAGKTPMELAASITEKLKKYVGDPHVTVVVTQMSGKWVCGDAPRTKAQQHQSPKIFVPLHLLPDTQDSPDGLIFPI